MGCDIHIQTEVKRNGQWELIKNPKIKQYSFDKWNATDHYFREIYEGRNYDLFAILADVRNGSGFAGIPTGHGYKSISLPKGLPEDFSHPDWEEHNEETNDCKYEWWLGDHSHSYLTLKELLDYDWDQETVNYFGLDDDVFEKNKRFLVENEEIDGRFVFDREIYPNFGDSNRPYKKCAAKVSYWVAAGEGFTLGTLPELCRLAQFADEQSPENVRIVFGFDS